MLSVVRLLIRLKAKEHILRTNYHRQHPHFPTYLAIDAILSVSLVLGLGQLSSTLASAKVQVETLTQAGAKVLSAQELIDHVPLPMHQGNRYWLGAFSGARYTTNCITPGVLKVSYLASGQALENRSTPMISITAYESQNILATEIHRPREYKERVFVNARGDALSFGDSMQKMRIARSNSEDIVVIDYAISQPLAGMVLDSERLTALD